MAGKTIEVIIPVRDMADHLPKLLQPLLDQLAAGDRVTVASAGTAPTGEVEPAVVSALAEVGIDAADAFPKPLTEEVVAGADVVVTMGCGDACPVVPGRRYLDWELADPRGADPETVRRIRDDIDARVQALAAELVTTPAGVTP